MFLLRIGLLLASLFLTAAYPLEGQAKPAQHAALDPADYPDLTHGLSDAEVESTLNGLSLDDLNALNKLLDDAGNGPFDLEASLRGHHRQAKKQHYDDMDAVDEDLEVALKSNKQSLDDSCHDEDDSDKEKDQCTERPKCSKRPTTRRCTSTTRRCATTACKSLDGFLDIHVDGAKFESGSKKNCKDIEECDPEDQMCLQRNHQRAKQRSNIQDFSDLATDQEPSSMDSLERLAAQAHRDESLKLHKQLDGWNGKDDTLPDVFNMDYGKLSNANAAGNMHDFKELPKLVAEDEGQPQQSEEESKQAELQMPYERHQLARTAHDQQQAQQQEDKEEDELDGSALDENAAPAAVEERGVGDEVEAAEPLPLANDMAANDGDSFIAQNAREPLRYLIQTENGVIKSENGPGEQQLQTDKRHSEMLNYDAYQLSNPGQTRLESKRYKRDSRKTDDAPENTNESYLKKLMDSFPRDQGGQSNLNMAIRQAKRTHFRVKRS
ncbi:uncharacterized protein LOC115765540 isoform X1 [Drosophila novamexicana]|uniref:uncharacterized protein LOC115765540 isoform X1 n=1 Tax=Drosophila novamexicana TaxID=47314 RepID=UPI0011E60749|nr:uncharacterized protein LOC115765540 isoform X1 [Drosophila novamexicana]